MFPYRSVTVRRPRPWEVGHSLLRSSLSVMPGHEFFQLGDLVVGYAAQRVGQPGLRIDTRRFKLVRFDQIQLPTDPAYLVKGLIPRSGFVVIWGPQSL